MDNALTRFEKAISEMFTVEGEHEMFKPWAGAFSDKDQALEKAESLHRMGFSVVVFRGNDVYCEYEQ
jgi:hypothetical protein